MDRKNIKIVGVRLDTQAVYLYDDKKGVISFGEYSKKRKTITNLQNKSVKSLKAAAEWIEKDLVDRRLEREDVIPGGVIQAQLIGGQMRKCNVLSILWSPRGPRVRIKM